MAAALPIAGAAIPIAKKGIDVIINAANHPVIGRTTTKVSKDGRKVSTNSFDVKLWELGLVGLGGFVLASSIGQQIASALGGGGNLAPGALGLWGWFVPPGQPGSNWLAGTSASGGTLQTGWQGYFIPPGYPGSKY